MKLPDTQLTFHTQAEIECRLDNRIVIGHSVEGREIPAFILGSGPIKVSLIAGAHADEPVGPETIRQMITNPNSDWFKQCTFYCIPQINPDGENRNQAWIKKWPDPTAYIEHVVREPPGKDIEFGYPNMRPENEAASKFWKTHGPFHLHLSLHGMGFAEGVMLLIQRHWTSRTQKIRDAYVKLAADIGLGLHNHNRKGEKGFFYIEDGFTTTPEGEAMRAYFNGIGDPKTAALFHDSSMEYIRSLGGDPLCLVTEIPLFSIKHSGNATMIPENYLRLKELYSQGKITETTLKEFEVRPVNINDAVNLQLQTIDLAINNISDSYM